MAINSIPLRLWSHVAVACVLALALGACGAAEWPPRQNQQIQGPAATSANTGSSLSFIGATAVRVGPGDTLYAISRRHKVSLRALIEANDLKPPFPLTVGQRLVLPQGGRHRVVAGDTLYGIANRYDVDPYATARINGLKPPYVIRVDEFLLIPADSVAPIAPPSSAKSKTVTSEALAPPPAKSSPSTTAPRPVAKQGRTRVSGASRSRPTPPKSTEKPARPALAPVPGSGFVWPVEGRVISGFGVRKGGLRNDGINISAPRGTPIRAAEKGVVAYVGNELRGFGNLVLIKHRNGWISAYAHTEGLNVRKGDRVHRGQQIANVGASGSVRRPQLHFELRRNKRAVDPRKFLGRATG